MLRIKRNIFRLYFNTTSYVRASSILIFLLVNTNVVSADPMYYWVRLLRGGEELNGFAKIDTAPDSSLGGIICTYDDISSVDSPAAPLPKGRLLISGIARGGKAEVSLRPGKDFDVRMSKRLGGIFHKYTLEKMDPADLHDTAEGMLLKNRGWDRNPLDEKSLSIEFHQVEVVPDRKKREQFIYLGDDAGTTFDLGRFDKLNAAQAMSITSKLNIYGVISPTGVRVLFRPDKAQSIVTWAKQYGSMVNTVELDNLSKSSCGSPFVEGTVFVPPLLEFYFARKLQLSGLVERAYPQEEYLTPPFQTMEVHAKEVTAPMEQANLTVDQKLASAHGFFEKELGAFLKQRRPKYTGKWEVTSTASGGSFAYKWQVVGPSVSECSRNGWEMFNLMVAFTPGSGPTIMISALDGFRAPGPLDKRPSDTRFKENSLSDDQLGKIQDDFYGFLVDQGIGPGDKSSGSDSGACPF
jgi:hypothetical protein